MSCPLSLRPRLSARRSTPSRRGAHVALARKQSFDEGAAQVANLLQRDEAELTGKSGIGSAAFSEFGQDAGNDDLATVEDFPEAFKPSSGGDVPVKSPFGGASASASTSAAPPTSPFGAPSTSGSASPFGDMGRMNADSEPRNLSPTLEPAPVDKAPWWTKITATQIVLFFTFTGMTLSMLATVLVVAKTGAIHFNDDMY